MILLPSSVYSPTDWNVLESKIPLLIFPSSWRKVPSAHTLRETFDIYDTCSVPIDGSNPKNADNEGLVGDINIPVLNLS